MRPRRRPLAFLVASLVALGMLGSVSFAVSADAYDRYIGRYSRPLASVFADFAAIPPNARILDVGCGPGALTSEIVARFGASSVVAVDPSSSFVAAIEQRLPNVAVYRAGAEHLPFDTDEFNAATAQLVVHFMSDPLAGIGEMRRVTRPGGVVAACVWDHAEGGGPLDVFWRAVHQLDPDAVGQASLPGTRRGDLGHLFRRAGLVEIDETALSVQVMHPTFAEWWDPFTLGVGPAGAYVAALPAGDVERLRDRCRALLPEAPLRVVARAWAAHGLVPRTG